MAKHDSDSPAEPESELKVTDRRLFTADGQLRGGVEEDQDELRGASPEVKGRPAPAATPGFERRPVEEPAGVDFGIVVNSMAELALLFLGEIPHPNTGEPTIDLRRARLQIDMLDLLRVKTRGNLSPEEEHLLESVLYELRMRYLHRSHAPQR
jgi:hypothetical protein